MSREGVKFQLRRARGLIVLLLRNKMAALGLSLLVAFSFIALAAPLLTPYSPREVVSGSLAQPEWVTSFPDGYYLSKNMVFSDDPGFRVPAALQEWTFTAPSEDLSRLQLSYDSDVSATRDSTGSVRLTHTGTSPTTVSLTRSLNYPYHGPPKKFTANFAILTSGATQAQPVHVRVFIERAGDATFDLWNENETLNNIWVPPASILLDSDGQFVKDILGAGAAPFSPAEIIFSAVQSYKYGIEVTFNGPQTVYIDNLDLDLFGTAWGLLGTDNAGLDLYTQLIYGSQISLMVGLLAASIGISLGLVVGLMAGFLGRFVDEVLMRLTDMMLVIPSLPLLIVLVAVLGQNIWNVVIIIGFLGWMGFARIVRSQVLTLRERPFVEAAKAAGAGPTRIITRHIFPNIVSLTYVNLALSVPAAILSESALAFLGLSDPAVTSWGNMFQRIQQAGALGLKPPPWWWVLPPGFSIAIVSLSFVLIGYALDEIFNPKLRRRR